ncbi:MAG: PIN domain-containing protein [Acidobacteria bacterium]|nr:PIN domain-containing protein [Acidobacteriota bacterium]
MSDDRTFVDTNVFVYAVDRHSAAKQKRAEAVLEALGPSIVISSQVLQEFYVAVTRKLATPLPAKDAERHVHDLSGLDVVLIDVPIIRAAIVLSRDHHLSFWDALVIEAARVRGCSRLLSEDLQDGREFGRVRIENPFAGLE